MKQRWTVWAIAAKLLFGAYAGLFVFDLLHAEPGAPLHPYYMIPLLPLGAAALIGAIRNLVRHWHDEDALADEFGTRQSYIPRREAIPVRVRATLFLAVTTAMFALGFWICIRLLFPAALGGASS